MANEAQLPALTPEQIQLLMRLEEIFMPQAKRQRDEAQKRQTKPGEAVEDLRIVHYTSAEAALKIIKSKRMWMRNANCMSDYREVQHGFDILNKFFSDKAKMDVFVGALDDCVPDAATEGINLFNSRWTDIRFNTFVTSVSEHDNTEDLHGRLSMWRAFGTNTARVAIVFKVPKFSGGAIALRLLFSPVAYLPESEVHAVIEEVIQNLGPNREFLRSIDRRWVIGIVFDMLMAGVTCLKHEGFREEREWRAIYCPNFNRSSLMESTIEVVGGFPQVVYQIPLDATVSPALAELDFSRVFHRLIIGPSPYPWPMFEAFRESLTSAGIADAKDRVWVSNIPIRTA
jgi:hypothetical protein